MTADKVQQDGTSRETDDTLSYEDFTNTFSMINWVLKLDGVHLTQQKSSGYLEWWRAVWLFVVNIFLLLMAVLCEIIFAVNTIMSNASFVEVISMMPCTCFCILALAKIIPLHYKRADAAYVIRTLHDLWPRKLNDKQSVQVVRDDIKEVNLASKAYFWTDAIVILIFILLPYMRMIYSKVTGVHLDKILPFSFWLPFDPYQGIVYHFVILLMSHNGIIAVAFQLGADLVFTISTSHLCTLYKLLAHDIEQAKDYKTLSSLIQKQNVLIGLSQHLESLFSFSMLVNCITSSILMCFCGFYALVIESLISIHYKLFMVTGLTQIGIMCWYGQKLLDVSNSVLKAAYFCEWYNTDRRFRSSILFLMQRTQKPMMVTACNFAVIGLASYAAILKASWSYFMFLMTVYEI